MEFKKGKYYRCLQSSDDWRVCYGHTSLFKPGEVYYCCQDGWLVNGVGTKTLMKENQSSNNFLIHK